MCMFSQRALNHFGWEIIFDEGLKIVDSNGEEIGRFEYYYGVRTDMGNNVYMNQSVIQRWVVTKEAFTEIQNMLAYSLERVADAKVLFFSENGVLRRNSKCGENKQLESVGIFHWL